MQFFIDGLFDLIRVKKTIFLYYNSRLYESSLINGKTKNKNSP